MELLVKKLIKSIMSKMKLHFYRFEFKYILPHPLRVELESELGYFMKLDPYVASKEEKKYKVRSLYYEDPVYSNYYEKIDGVKTRAKFRIRTYTTDANEKCATFLEIKGRHNALVFKHRTPLDVGNEGNFSIGEELKPQNVLERVDSSQVSQQFEYESFKKRLFPVILIDYTRRPLFSKYDSEFRVTFDDSLRGTVTKSLYPSQREISKKILSGYTIMEVKFRYHVPKWFHRLIQSYELKRVSISKVCSGIELFKLADAL